MSVTGQIVEQARAQSPAEIVAVLSAIAYLLLAIRQNILCWLFAAISTAIYVVLFIEARLYMESALNAFYLLMAIYGWYVWRGSGGELQEREVVVWPLRWHVVAIATLFVISAANGWLLQSYSDAAIPYIDSATTWFAIWATFLVARKVLENWWYLLVVDIVSVAVFWSRDMQLTSILFAAYVVMIPFGLLAWRRSMLERSNE